MRYIFSLILYLNFFSSFSQIAPVVSLRVDTANVNIKNVYKLWSSYLSSRPDSMYQNPYWNKNEVEYYSNSGMPGFDRSSMSMFNAIPAKQYFHWYKPIILSIDSIDNKRWKIRTLFYSEKLTDVDKKYENLKADCIVNLYAIKNSDSNYYLENAINYNTRNWKKYKIDFITYVVHPDCSFNLKKANEAVSYCKGIVKKFKLPKVEPFTYYMTPNDEEMSKLYNFDYQMSYSTGRTNYPIRQIVSAFGIEDYRHEFVHMLFPMNAKENENGRPRILTEGIATWLAGPKAGESFSEALKKFGKEILKNDTLTLDDIMNQTYAHALDSSPLYVTGGVICEEVYNKSGVEGVMRLWNVNSEDEFKVALEKELKMKYYDIGPYIINRIKAKATL